MPINISNGTLGVEQSWSCTTNYRHERYTLTAKTEDGKYSKVLASNVNYSVISAGGKWTPPLEWANCNTTGESVIVFFYFDIHITGENRTLEGSGVPVIYSIPESIIPTVSVAVSDATGFADIYGKYIQGESKLNVAITGAGSYGSTIRSYRANFDGRSYTSANVTTETITASGNLTLKISVTDSRGRQATKSVDIPVAEYAVPAITAFSVNRCADADGNGVSGNFLKVTFDSRVFALENQNTASYVLHYKKSTETEYTAIELTDYADQYSVSGGVYIFAADSASSYNVRLVITDGLDVGSKTALGASVYKFFSFLGKGLGLALGKMAELAGVFEIAFQTKFTGGVMHPVLEDQTDLNDVKIPNTYAGKNANSAGYLNIPFTAGTFTLTVEEAGNGGQLRQIIILCDKKISRVWERFYYGGAWGDWICTSDFGGKLLWSGGHYMSEKQTANLAEPISKQARGIVLCWSWFNTSTDEASDSYFQYFFIPKYHITAHDGNSVSCNDYHSFMKKVLYVHDTYISGYLTNDDAGTDTLTGLAYDNTKMVLRAVIGV